MHILLFLLLLLYPDSGFTAGNSFSPVVKKVFPAVVDLHVERKGTRGSQDDILLSRMFGVELSPSRVAGSGILVKDNGLLVTAAHVVIDAEQIIVTLDNGEKEEFVTVVIEKASDLAILKPKKLGKIYPYLEIADSDKVEVGDQVLAVGNPFEIGKTVTGGIISALSKGNIGGNKYRSFIQTDAAINPGNSGGALVDMQGRLLGINDAIFSKNGSYNGIGFAVPSNLVTTLLANAKVTAKGVKVLRPWIGISVQDLNAEILESLNMPTNAKGVLVRAVVKAGPSAKAGIRAGDVISSIDGNEILGEDSFKYRVATSSINSPLAVIIQRGGEKIDCLIAPTLPLSLPEPRTVKVFSGNIFRDVSFSNLSPAVAIDLGLDEGESGVAVSAVGSQNVMSSLKIGDIIKGINGVKIRNTEDMMQIIKGIKNARISLNIKRNHRYISMQFRGIIGEIGFE